MQTDHQFKNIIFTTPKKGIERAQKPKKIYGYSHWLRSTTVCNSTKNSKCCGCQSLQIKTFAYIHFEIHTADAFVLKAVRWTTVVLLHWELCICYTLAQKRHTSEKRSSLIDIFRCKRHLITAKYCLRYVHIFGKHLNLTKFKEFGHKLSKC